MKNFLFATTLLGASLSLALSGTGGAVVVWFSGADIPIPTTFEGVSVNLETGAFLSGDLPGADANFFFGGFAIGNDGFPAATVPTWQPVRIATTDATIANLTVGTPIGPGGPYTTGFAGSLSHIPSEFTAGTPGYIGFSLVDSNLDTVYGWMLVTLEAGATEGVIHKWVFQDNGSAIPAGIPEPTTPLLGLLALGALALRRRRT